MVQKKPLFSWIFERYRGLQLLLLGLIVLTIFFRVFPLEMQKRIVNEAIRFRKLEVLLLYCGLYLAAVVLAGALKYLINTVQGYIGQKILYEMRSQLYEHILQLPMPFFRKTPPGMVISFLTSELSAVGDFLGSGLTVPAINILSLLSFIGYMFYLNPLLALLSICVYPIEIIIVPLIQKRLNRLNENRIDVTRSLSNAVGETISGMHEVHGNGSYALENRRFQKFAGELFALRHRMNIFKFGLKYSNNFFQSLGPFILFLVGGILSIRGRLDLGALVAFLSAYEKLYDPWKELLDYYQDFQDSRVRYQRVMNYFDVEPEFALEPVGREPFELKGEIRVQDLRYTVDGRIRLLDQVSMSVQPGEQVALVGFSGSGKSTLAMVLGQLYSYSAGHVYLDGMELKTLSKMDISPNIGYVAQHPFIFDGSIRDNLLYACEALNHSEIWRQRNTFPDQRRMLEVVRQVGLGDDVLRFGLDSVLSRETNPALIQELIKIRGLFYRQWGKTLAGEVEFIDPKQYLYQSSVLDNIVFGSPESPAYELKLLAGNALFREFLEETELLETLLVLGRELARRTVRLLQDLRGDTFFFEASPIPEDQFDQYGELVERLENLAMGELSQKDRDLLVRLALRFIPARHKMLALPASLEAKILQARRLFVEKIQSKDPEAFSFHCQVDYLYNNSILNNILFGRLKADQPQALEQVQQRVVEMLEQEELLDEVLGMGLEFQVGSKGDRLSGGQRQKIALTRAFLKNPHILIMDEATASLDNVSQARIQQLLETEFRGRCTVVAVVHRLDTVAAYDQIAVMKAGKIVENGKYQELMARKGIFHGLVQGTRAPM